MDKYISIRQILDDILAHPLLQDVSLERAINHTIHFMRIVGSPRMFTEKTAKVSIENYRGVLPDDLETIIQVRSDNNQTFIYSSDNFHMSDNKESSSELTYKVQGNCIYTSMQNGNIEIAYNAIELDEEGWPKIPDNSSFIRALELYIKKQHFTVLFDMGQIHQAVFNQVCQDYAFAVGQAQSDLIRPTIDQMQAITDSFHSLLWSYKEHSTGFSNARNKKYIETIKFDNNHVGR